MPISNYGAALSPESRIPLYYVPQLSNISVWVKECVNYSNKYFILFVGILSGLCVLFLIFGSF